MDFVLNADNNLGYGLDWSSKVLGNLLRQEETAVLHFNRPTTATTLPNASTR